MNTSNSFKHQSLGAIASSLPGATAVFRKFGLDFCCCGDRELMDEATLRGVDSEAVAQALELLQPQPTDFPLEPFALIDHILTRYHAVHRAELPELIELANKVDRVHQQHPDVSAGLADLLTTMHAELDVHMQKEEAVLFLMMQAGDTTRTGHPIAQMRYEHRQHGNRLHELEQLTRGFQPPPDACASWKALYAGTKKLSDDLMMHIHLENNVLFPQFVADPAESKGCW